MELCPEHVAAFGAVSLSSPRSPRQSEQGLTRRLLPVPLVCPSGPDGTLGGGQGEMQEGDKTPPSWAERLT